MSKGPTRIDSGGEGEARHWQGHSQLPMASFDLDLCQKHFFFLLFRAFTMSPEQFQYIWRKTIPHIEVGMGSGVFTSHRSARFVFISDWWTRRNEVLDRKGKENGTIFLTRPRCPLDPKPAFQQASPVGRGKRAFPSRFHPATGSPTATLLRLHPSRRPHRGMRQ